MQNERTLLNLGGIAAVCFAGVQLVYIVILVIGLNFNLVLMGELNPEDILRLYQNTGQEIGLLLKLFSFLFLIPALVGLFAFLSRHALGLARIGFLYAIFAYGIIFIITFFQFGIVRDLAVQSEMTSFAMQNDILNIQRIIQYLETPNQFLYLAFMLTWGMAFKKADGFRPWLAGILLLVSAGFLALMLIFSYVAYQKTTSIFFILSSITSLVAYFIAGTALFNVANQHYKEEK